MSRFAGLAAVSSFVFILSVASLAQVTDVNNTTAVPIERDAVTAMRMPRRSFARIRATNADRRTARPVFCTAAMSRERRRRAARIMSARSDDGEALAAARTTSGEHFAAARRLHARAKTVHSRATTRLRLVRALHDRVPSPRKAMGVNEMV